MRRFPVPDPGLPDTRSSARYMLWLARNQWTSLASGMWWGVCWMLSIALVPAVLGHTIDVGISARNGGELVRWSLLLVLLGGFGAVAGVLRHRNAVTNWLASSYRTVQVVTRHVPTVGATLPKLVATGDVVAIGTADISNIGGGFDVLARTAGAIVSICVVAAIMLNASVSLGLTVIIGVPALMGLMALVMRPLHLRQDRYRELQTDLTTRATDIAAGLRVLRGIGGEQTFEESYRVSSQGVRLAGVRVARVESLLSASEIFAPGVFAAIVTWLAATYAVRHQLSVGSLISFYGYATFMTMPLSTLGEAADGMTRAFVASGRVIKVLRLTPEIVDDAPPADDGASRDSIRPAAALRGLSDAVCGLEAVPGGLLAVVCSEPADAVLISERLARFRDSGAPTLDGVPLAALPLAEVRSRILLARNDDRLFPGTLRAELTPIDRDLPEPALAAAVHTASAEDIVAQLDEGLDTVIDDDARSLSGGQQQRLRLARALAADPETLILVEPTSAVDAHTEARIADRLAAARAGKATIVFTSSPLVLDRADRVNYLEDGIVVASGRHRELLADCAAYRAVVTRGED
jgi:ABC-type multidrug transport system fused ATPase/permease subunit